MTYGSCEVTTVSRRVMRSSRRETVRSSSDDAWSFRDDYRVLAYDAFVSSRDRAVLARRGIVFACDSASSRQTRGSRRMTALSSSGVSRASAGRSRDRRQCSLRSEEHTSELQSPCNLVCRLLLEKKKIKLFASVIKLSAWCYERLDASCSAGTPTDVQIILMHSAIIYTL